MNSNTHKTIGKILCNGDEYFPFILTAPCMSDRINEK